ncbi:MAG: TPM domain-containing protein [Ferruginibacter sp.]|nr:TPM domain-containing protein [Ferruginibacter sp.]
MKVFPFFKKKSFFTDEEKARIVEAIRKAEKQTSGEVRVFVESKNAYVDPMDRAAEVFYNLKMDKTDDRNAVLLYMAVKDRELVLFGDEGIYNATGQNYWNDAVKAMLEEFSGDDICGGMEHCIAKIGNTLKEKFPYNIKDDKNELPDEIVFGK